MRYLLFALCVSLQLCAIDYNGVHEIYQDVFINNNCVKRGVRECNDRYLALQEIFDLYDRPFTILDIGAAQGYFCFRACYEYDATGVMIEDGYVHGERSAVLLKELCQENSEIDNLIILRKKIDLDDLKRLAECEFFDVVLALDMLPHLVGDFREYIDVLKTLGTNVVIESSTDIEPQINEYIESLNPELLGVASRHSSVEGLGLMWWFYGPIEHIVKRQHWFAEPYTQPVTIEADFFEKLRVTGYGSSEIIENVGSGINLMTFKALGGYYPTVETLVKKLSDMPLKSLGNPLPWNLMLNGGALFPIRRRDNTEVHNRQKAEHYTYRVVKSDSKRFVKFWKHREHFLR